MREVIARLPIISLYNERAKLTPLVSYDGIASPIKQEPDAIHSPLIILDKTGAPCRPQPCGA
ncbi:MAG: hypothetical protein KKA10_17900 [Euryarchaeota archaeon]|nr:hypothetical protein [Euryarchaeota archaeon]MCG2737939.1 hypothetical protein [Candidatus Methanoperedenaceae archaeon]